jgi:hypothetical protein
VVYPTTLHIALCLLIFLLWRINWAHITSHTSHLTSVLNFHHEWWTFFTSKHVAWPCHSQSCLSLTSHHGGPGSLLGKFTRDLWWKKWHCDRFYWEHQLPRPPSISIPPVLHIHPSAIWGDGVWAHDRQLFQETESHPIQRIKTRALPQGVWARLVEIKLHAFLLWALEQAECVVLCL